MKIKIFVITILILILSVSKSYSYFNIDKVNEFAFAQEIDNCEILDNFLKLSTNSFPSCIIPVPESIIIIISLTSLNFIYATIYYLLK